MNNQPRNINAEDAIDLIWKIESSFNLRFADNELTESMTFGELCDFVESKIQLNNIDDCTTQQAFYKLRNAISESLQIDERSISPNLQLTEFLPRKNRRTKIKKLEEQLNIELNILHPKGWIILTLIIIFLISFVLVFFYWKVGVIGLLFSYTGFKLADRTKNELELETVGQVAKKMTREHYLKSRRNPDTFNKDEIEKVLNDLTTKLYALDEGELTRDTRFV